MRIFFFSAVFLTLSFNSFSQSFSPSFQYPLRVGTEEWKSVKSYDDLREILQISSEKIGGMDTPSLLANVLNYPLIGDLFLYNSFKTGLHRLRENFYAFGSLLARQDLLRIVLTMYKSADPEDILSINGEIEAVEFMLRISLLEELIWFLESGDSIKNNLLLDAERVLLSADIQS